MNYSLLTKIAAPAGLLLLAPLMFRLNLTRFTASGGPVSAAQRVWWAYLVYVYLFLSPLLAFDLALPALTLTCIRYFSILIYFRAALQCFFIFRLKKWSPLLGFCYNIFCLFQLSYILAEYSGSSVPEQSPYHSSSLFLLLLVNCLVVDSVYALLKFRVGYLDTRLLKALNSLSLAGLFLLLLSFYLI
ncbi:hypothetical protein ACMA1I_12000 [Pontibacter sp. 13R65]|uniref:hypothetical protein n=1 Tax=Pontibacter sp. 13R65 TaxID=3127458 RepID=UPI00301C6E75